ncbi:Hypothetical protein SSO12127 [Saccharolobus solfataricus P2]|uniref:Uncharacterized protein n=2 Tax=Saccharolobus solfataricus TaxID=2287 RepID=Q97U44_SACS2|nr:Hypothetical protein SSO12127 [Saccharolobus solfataricus P2]SAI86824.1 uncharacterised protein [Saccharolobus solfataricus]
MIYTLLLKLLSKFILLVKINFYSFTLCNMKNFLVRKKIFCNISLPNSELLHFLRNNIQALNPSLL